MKLVELIESCLVKDEHEMMIHVPIIGAVRHIRCGHWFNDQILDLQNREIDCLTFNGHTWDIELRFQED